MLFTRPYPDWCYHNSFIEWEKLAGVEDKISMISQNKLDLLTDEETDILLYILNKIAPPGFQIEVNMNMIKYYQVHILKDIIEKSKSLIKEENVQILDSILIKLFEDPSRIIT
jgi:hypothetical protein